MLSLSGLVSDIRLAKNRTRTFDAIRQVAERFPGEAFLAFKAILDDPDSSNRCKAIILYYFREFDLFPSLVVEHEPRFRPLVDAIFQDVELMEDEGFDPFVPESSS